MVNPRLSKKRLVGCTRRLRSTYTRHGSENGTGDRQKVTSISAKGPVRQFTIEVKKLPTELFVLRYWIEQYVQYHKHVISHNTMCAILQSLRKLHEQLCGKYFNLDHSVVNVSSKDSCNIP